MCSNICLKYYKSSYSGTVAPPKVGLLNNSGSYMDFNLKKLSILKPPGSEKLQNLINEIRCSIDCDKAFC